MSYLFFEELSYQTVEEMNVEQTRPLVWYPNPVLDEPAVMPRSVRFREPMADILLFDKNDPPHKDQDPNFSFQIPCDTIRPSHHAVLPMNR